MHPTVVILGYGMASSFDGKAGLPKFKEDMGRLVAMIQGLGTNPPARLVFLSPIRHEKLSPPLPPDFNYR